MNWWQRPEWMGFVHAVRTAPDEITPRLVAADWLEGEAQDFGSPESALARAEVIRLMCGGSGMMPHRFHRREVMEDGGTNRPGARSIMHRAVKGTPLETLEEGEWVGGFLLTACFASARFSSEKVAPVMCYDPVRRVEVANIYPLQVTDEGPYPWQWDQGPGNVATGAFRTWQERVGALAQCDDFLPGMDEAGNLSERAAFVDAALRRGVPCEELLYAAFPNMLPAPVFNEQEWVVAGTDGGKCPRSMYETCIKALTAAYAAAFRAAWYMVLLENPDGSWLSPSHPLRKKTRRFPKPDKPDKDRLLTISQVDPLLMA